MIRLRNVSLDRRIAHENELDLKRSFFALLRGRHRRAERRMVLRDVSFEANRGERLGVIGPNGAGKSTLLKVIAGILPVTRGEVEVTGSVAPLIELGAGFDPELSVYDNVVLYGVLLGFPRRRMLERMDAILAFGELEPYRWELVKMLSSGMAARLGFAIASDGRPDVLLLDEVLAVGDESFRAKSRERIEARWAEGATSVIVSHDLAFVAEECDRALCMAAGRIAFIGAPRTAVRFYLDTLHPPERP